MIGAGAWGTALALAAAQAGRSVTLWARESGGDRFDPQHARQNALFLPGRHAARSTFARPAIWPKRRTPNALLLAVPAQHLRATLATLAPLLAPRNAAGALRQGHRARHRQVADRNSRRARAARAAGDPVRSVLRARCRQRAADRRHHRGAHRHRRAAAGDAWAMRSSVPMPATI